MRRLGDAMVHDLYLESDNHYSGNLEIGRVTIASLDRTQFRSFDRPGLNVRLAICPQYHFIASPSPR
jgi:hypothetical protein